MLAITLNNAIKNFAALPPQILGGDEIVNITTDEGNIILISEESYKSLILMNELNANPDFKNSLLQGMGASSSDLVHESEVKW